MTALVHEQKQNESESELPAPELSINPDHEQHGAARFQDDRQKLERRQKKKLQFREKFCDQDRDDSHWPERFLRARQKRVALVDGCFRRKIHERTLSSESTSPMPIAGMFQQPVQTDRDPLRNRERN